MVIAHNNPRGSGTSDEEICKIIAEEVASAIREVIPEMFGSIKTTLIETLDERYVVVTEAAVVVATAALAAARPQGIIRCCFGSTAKGSHRSSTEPRTRLLL